MIGIRSPLDGMGLVITALCAKSLGKGRSPVAAAIPRLSFTKSRRVSPIESSFVRLNLSMKWDREARVNNQKLPVEPTV
jgi:hypothetical protein